MVVGAVAQLGERDVRNVEVRGSIPLGSTKHFREYMPSERSLTNNNTPNSPRVIGSIEVKP